MARAQGLSEWVARFQYCEADAWTLADQAGQASSLFVATARDFPQTRWARWATLRLSLVAYRATELASAQPPVRTALAQGGGTMAEYVATEDRSGDAVTAALGFYLAAWGCRIASDERCARQRFGHASLVASGHDGAAIAWIRSAVRSGLCAQP